jgi:hypothetical protein
MMDSEIFQLTHTGLSLSLFRAASRWDHTGQWFACFRAAHLHPLLHGRTDTLAGAFLSFFQLIKGVNKRLCHSVRVLSWAAHATLSAPIKSTVGDAIAVVLHL